MKTSRLALAVVLVVGGGWLAAAAYTKHKVEQSYRDEIARIEKRLPMVHVADLKQEGGLLSGTYSGVVYLGCAPVNGKPHPRSFAVAFQDRVQYGPLPGFKSFGAASVDSSLALTDTAPAELRAALAKLEPMRIHSTYSYGGGMTSQVTVPAGKMDIGGPVGKMSLHWAEMRADVQGTTDRTHIAYSWTVPELGMGMANGEGRSLMEMQLKNLTAKSDTQGRADSWLRTGHEESSLERFEVTTVAGPDQPPINVIYDRLSGRFDITQQADLLDVNFGYNVGGLQAGNAGPFSKVANVEMAGKLTRLHAPSLEKAMAALFSGMEGECAMDPSAAPQPPGAWLKGTMDRVGDSVKGVMAQGPVFSIDKLAFELAGKRGEMSASASLQGVDMDLLWKGGPEAQQALMKGAKVQAKARMPLGWLALSGGGTPEQTAAMADGVVAQGWAQRDGEFLKTDFSFADGLAKVNGVQVFPPQAPPSEAAQ